MRTLTKLDLLLHDYVELKAEYEKQSDNTWKCRISATSTTNDITAFSVEAHADNQLDSYNKAYQALSRMFKFIPETDVLLIVKDSKVLGLCNSCYYKFFSADIESSSVIRFLNINGSRFFEEPKKFDPRDYFTNYCPNCGNKIAFGEKSDEDQEEVEDE